MARAKRSHGMVRALTAARLEGVVMSFALWVLGFIIMVIGVALGAYYLHVPAHWIGVTVLILVGMGVATGVASTRHRDPS